MARRGNPELVDQLDQAARLDERLRELATDRDAARRRVNELSKQVGQLRREGAAPEAEAAMAASRREGERESELASEAAVTEADLRDVLLRIPNLPHPDAPDGAGEDDNPVV